MTTVVVVEPHALLRFGILRHLTKVLPESQLRGADYSSFSRSASTNGETDLVLLSVPMQENMIELVNATWHAYSPKWILLLSDTSATPSSWQNLPEAVVGYIPRSASPEVLAASIRLVLVGGKCFQSSAPPGISTLRAPLEARPPLKPSRKTNPTVPLADAEAEMLHITPRQYEVLVLLARGYPMKTVSRHLNISIATAKAHTETLYQRLDAHNRNQAVYTAVSRGATLGWRQLESTNLSEPEPTMTAA